MMGDGPMPDIMAGASFGTALRIALCTVVIVARRSAGRAARNASRMGRALGMRRGWAPEARRSNLNKLRRFRVRAARCLACVLRQPPCRAIGLGALGGANSGKARGD